ncbi:fungal zn(2)-Cys(6) binuclear cluster domain-containing protein [Rhizoctonia solani AG-1 IA]|uniref:Fungal zn(2)-Cys(6) binuclear cluster domain-containing protein n=1 Tax=Thanatephorus cucumeris (strain AG1-IA) TaxID=983506 RepID=L8WTY9_THACA|nr:fungal zn(2)-Cys(6) binuclear cluster domain-containing protein [Rhizoctonia solani AG-1 IA]
MSTRGKLTPGPVGVSCLTCRRRYVLGGLDLPTRADPRARTSHKKCDLQRPACDQCLKGGYECLGYKHVKSKGYGYDQRLPSDHTSPADSSSGLLGSSAPSLSPRSDDGPRRDANLSADITAVSEGLANNVTSAQPGVALVRKDLSNLFSFFNEDAVIYDTFPPTRSQTQVTENEILSPLCSASNQRPIFPTNPLLFQLASPTLKGVPISPDVCGIAEYVVSHFGRILSLTYFSPRDEIEKLRRMAIWRLSTCKFSRQSMLIATLCPDAKVQWSVLRGNHLMHASAFTRWIEGFEQAVRTRLGTHLTGYELQERLNDVLELIDLTYHASKAVCGVPTDDPRIQVALKQVFQLIGVIRRQDPPVSNAGICSRTEKQRKIVRTRLGCVDETRMWSFRSAEIVPVLDHLWLGAGMGGQPVTWNNYFHSRRTALPLPS